MSLFLAFDVQTPNGANDRICAMGLSWIQDKVIQKSERILVNPQCSFDEKNIAMHHIRPEDAEREPAFEAFWKRYRAEFLSANLILAHHAERAVSVLSKTLLAYNLHEDPLTVVDTQDLAKVCFPGLPSYKLNIVRDVLKLEDRPDALQNGSLVSAEIFCEALRQGINVLEYVKSYALDRIRDPKSKAEAHSKTVSPAPAPVFQKVDATKAQSEISAYLTRNGTPVEAAYQKKIDEIAAHLKAKNVCIAGNFLTCQKSEISTLIAKLGGLVKSGLNKKTHLLILGQKDADAGIHPLYNQKTQDALLLNREGAQILVVLESDFLSALQRPGPIA